MRPDVLIVGQGLAGTLLAWELERAGIAFAIADGGHASAATTAAAGIVNPITGRRLVKSWRVDELLPEARRAYLELEAALGVRLWHEVRVRRIFADETERRIFAAKTASGELAPFADAAHDQGFWIAPAARVDVHALLAAARRRWAVRELEADVSAEIERHALTIDCTGLAGARSGRFAFVPWEFSKGEIVELAVDGLAPDEIVNRRHWIVPVAPGRAWVGATHEPGICDAAPSAGARATLRASARELLGRESLLVGQRAGVRVNLPDRRPVVGRHPHEPRLGLINGLGAKGVQLAPWLARNWAEHLATGGGFEVDISVERFPASSPRSDGS